MRIELFWLHFENITTNSTFKCFSWKSIELKTIFVIFIVSIQELPINYSDPVLRWKFMYIDLHVKLIHEKFNVLNQTNHIIYYMWLNFGPFSQSFYVHIFLSGKWCCYSGFGAIINIDSRLNCVNIVNLIRFCASQFACFTQQKHKNDETKKAVISRTKNKMNVKMHKNNILRIHWHIESIQTYIWVNLQLFVFLVTIFFWCCCVFFSDSVLLNFLPLIVCCCVWVSIIHLVIQ